jgi:hypothetical protein
MSETRLSILQHALGVDQYGRGQQYRSHYVAGRDSDVWSLLTEMTTEGLMVNFGSSAMYGGDYCFAVTDRGREYVDTNSPAPPKRTRSQKRYDEFLDADSGMTFGEWLKRGAR